MRFQLAGLSASLALALAGPSQAAIIVATFSGVVDGGMARGVFGYAYDAPADLAGKSITGTIRYDTDRLAACDYATSFFGCFYGQGLSMTQTINGVTEVFPGEPLAGDPPYNEVSGGVQLYNLVGEEVAFHTATSLGDPGTVYQSRDAGVSVSFPTGGLPGVDSPILTYGGPVTNGNLAIGTFTRNTTSLYELTGGDLTQNASYQFTITQFGIGSAVPEPSSWSLMILGFGAVGTSIRCRRRRLPRAAAA